MTTFVLLHGAWHGGWCWEPMRAELTSLGFDSIALDLPSGAPDAGAERHAEVIAEAVRGHSGDELVLVPHSLAGLYAPVAAARIGASAIVNLAALTPAPGMSGLKQSKALPGIYTEPYRRAPMTRHDDGSTSVPRAVADEMFYLDCTPEQADWGFAQLRPQFWTAWVEECPFSEWPNVRYAHVACLDDQVLGAEGMVDGAERTSAPLTWIPGGHLPMVAHPREAAEAVVAAWSGLASSG